MIFFVPRVMSLTNNLIVSKLRAFIDHVIVLFMFMLSFIDHVIVVHVFVDIHCCDIMWFF